VKFQRDINGNFVWHQERTVERRTESDKDAARTRMFFARLAFPKLLLLSGRHVEKHKQQHDPSSSAHIRR
jgi:hypothetical protein